MSVHGGPEWHERDAFDAETQAFVDAGYAVALVNYRGSTGYGIAFREALAGNPWFPETEDVIAGLDALIAAGITDPDRVAPSPGWSWGGCLACLNVGLHPDRWKAVFAGIPAGDMVVAHYASMPEIQAYDVALYGGTPEGVPELWRERNPMTYVDRAVAPVLVIAGEEDPAVSDRGDHAVGRCVAVTRRAGRRAPLSRRASRERSRSAGPAHAADPGLLRALRLTLMRYSSPAPDTTMSLICSTISAFASVVTSPSGRPRGHVARQPPHDLARPRLRQVRREDDPVRPRDLPDHLRDVIAELLGHGVVPDELRLQRHERHDGLTDQVVGPGHRPPPPPPSDRRPAPLSISYVESRCPATFMTSSILPSSQ